MVKISDDPWYLEHGGRKKLYLTIDAFGGPECEWPRATKRVATLRKKVRAALVEGGGPC